MPRIEIDINQPEFLQVEKQALKELIDKHEQYARQGRFYEAKAMYRAVSILYRALKGDFHDTEPTGWDSL